jgi:hypothetical protein
MFLMQKLTNFAKPICIQNKYLRTLKTAKNIVAGDLQ